MSDTWPKPRDTRLNEWPEPKAKVLVWHKSIGWHASWPMDISPLWIPAPPSPEEEA